MPAAAMVQRVPCARSRVYSHGVCARRSARPHAGVRARAAPQVDKASGWLDEWSELDDRRADEPVALPTVSRRRRVVLVRHGQSTWNAQGIMQGSSNNSELTAKGIEQAKVTQGMLQEAQFDKSFVSPLRRAQSTTEIVWSDEKQKPLVLPSLREIDLYSFQGMQKAEAEKTQGQKYQIWKNQPDKFETDGHYPVKELWYRASTVWRDILGDQESVNTLVVAHNAINQALLCRALGLQPDYFRRFVQSNAALTSLDFFPVQNKSVPKVVIDRMNQSPSQPGWSKTQKDGQRMQFVLMRHAATERSMQGVILGTDDENTSKEGKQQIKYMNDFLKDLEVDKVISSPTKRTVQTGYALAQNQTHKKVEITLREDLRNIYLGDWQGKTARAVSGQPPPKDAESLESLWVRVGDAWQDIIQQASSNNDRTVVIVAHSAVLAAIMGHALELSPEYTSIFRLSLGSISVIEFPKGVRNGVGNIACSNYTSHLKQFTDPTTLGEDDTEDDTCGWDGCF